MNKLATILPGGRVRLRTVEPTMPAPASSLGVVAGEISVHRTVEGDPSSLTRMQIAGERVGIFASPLLAEQTKRMLTRCIVLFAALAFGGKHLSAAQACPFEPAPVVKVWPGFEVTVAGVASWYGEEYRGRPMANGVAFNPDLATAAMDGVPLGSLICVRSGRRTAMLFVTDRCGPAVRRNGRLLDLSAAAFRQLAPLAQGLVDVRVEIVWRAES